MKKEHLIIQNKLVKANSFTIEEVKKIFPFDEWKRTSGLPQSVLESVGITPPNKTFFIAASGSSVPEPDGKIAGICVLRNDEKDRPIGVPVNWNHWDFYLDSKDATRVLLCPGKSKQADHQFKTETEWQNRIKEKPPHKDYEPVFRE